ncbi:MAG: DUF420 domain-containing protein [Candidatus Marinimicrobia bacterium]|nr:DUF420 domain-containing protein [Candidatus Neomarinimicrobiota bacterium]
MRNTSTYWKIISGVLSALLLLVVSYLVYGPKIGDHSVDVSLLPHLNVTLNGLSGLALLAGYFFIQRKQERAHQISMLSAFTLSSAFLISYVLYHYFQSVPKSYLGQFPWLYYPILIMHILLAAAIAPLILITLYRGWIDNRQKHKNIAKWTFPLWLAVSISGVIIYFMLYR